MKREVYGSDHAEVAGAVNNLAGVLVRQGEVEDAAALYEECLRVRNKLLGEGHPAVAEVHGNIGAMLVLQGRLGDALPCFETVLRILTAAYGRAHRAVATAMCKLAELHRELGLYERARRLYASALDIRNTLFVRDSQMQMTQTLRAAGGGGDTWAALDDSDEMEVIALALQVSHTSFNIGVSRLPFPEPYPLPSSLIHHPTSACSNWTMSWPRNRPLCVRARRRRRRRAARSACLRWPFCGAVWTRTASRRRRCW